MCINRKRTYNLLVPTFLLFLQTTVVEVNRGTVGTVWFPGKKMEGLAAAPVSARALEIAKNREELLLLLHDLPESEYELSFTDLVEKGTAAGNQTACEGKSLDEEGLSRTMVVKEKRRSSRSSLSGSRSSSDGVLLNFYVPTALSRSVTTPKSSHRPMSDCNKR